MSESRPELSEVEGIKLRSNYLRGTLVDSLADAASGALAEDDTQISKFHGFYQQDDRDLREERRRRMLEPDHSFMIRARLPGGVCSPEQWLALDEIATRWANASLRLTTRQAFQFHGVIKRDLKASIRAINDSLLDTIAACGDVNRNVMCTPLPEFSPLHAEVVAHAATLSEHLLPRTRAYHEIWLDGTKTDGTPPVDHEPLYGERYLPRKFKIAFAIPPQNDVDVYAHDLGFIAIRDAGGGLAGYNVTVGGGMGATHGDPGTYPRLADLFGFCTAEQVNELGETIVAIQRDFGDRGNRKHARFKYTVADRGLDWLRAEFEARAGWSPADARPFAFTGTGDRYGWQRTSEGRWHLLLHIENGRIADTHLDGLREIARIHRGEFRLTPNQNLVIAGVTDGQRDRIDTLVADHRLDGYRTHSLARRNAMACVALPTCSLAMAEAERYLPSLVAEIEQLLERHGLQQEDLTIRMTGCPNGCARPYLAEIGLVGKGPGRYNLHLGASHLGDRLNTLVLENADEPQILAALEQRLARFAAQRAPGQRFGDFIHANELNTHGDNDV